MQYLPHIFRLEEDSCLTTIYAIDQDALANRLSQAQSAPSQPDSVPQQLSFHYRLPIKYRGVGSECDGSVPP